MIVALTIRAKKNMSWRRGKLIKNLLVTSNVVTVINQYWFV